MPFSREQVFNTMPPDALTTTVTLRELQEVDWPVIQACLADEETVRYTEFEPFTEASARWMVQVG